MDVSIKQLENFTRVYELLNITRAARELFMTQQALSKSLAALESEVGLSLFERRPSGLLPTRAADVLYERAKIVLDAMGGLEAAVGKLSKTVSGHLCVGFTQNLVGGGRSAFPVEFFLGFQRENPDVEFELCEHSSDDLERMVAAGSVDLACVVGPCESEGLDVLASAHDLLCVCLAKSHPLAGAASLGPEDLQDEAILIPPGNENTKKQVARLFADCRRPRIIADELSQQLRFEYVYNGLGISLMPMGSNPALDTARATLVPLRCAERTMRLDLIARCGRSPLDVETRFVRAFEERARLL